MRLLLQQIGNLTKDFEAFAFRGALQRMFSEKRNDLIEDFRMRADRIAITLSVILSLLFLKVNSATIQCVSHFFEQFPIALLHLQMKMHLDADSRSIRGVYSHVDIETTFAIG